MDKLRQPMQMTRLDSCRACGKQLEVKTRCDVCTQPKTFTCKGCTHWADDPPHDCKMFLK